MRAVKIALVSGLALLVIAIGFTLARSPSSVARTSRPAGAADEPIASTTRNTTYCQPHERLPRGTSAIRIWLDAAAGPRVNVDVSAGGRTIVSGKRGSGWVGGSVTVPVKPLPQVVSDATVCASVRAHDETVIVQGSAARATNAAHEGTRALGGRMWIEYLRPGTRSWASLSSQVARRMGFGRAGAGILVVVLAFWLLVAVAVLASRLVVEEIA